MIEMRSGCPINLALEVLGDRWSLIVIRDIMFGNRRHFRELLTRSEEGIASNILAARLKRLVETGLLSRSDDPAHRQKGIYSLTEKAIQLAPVLVQLGAWGRRHLPTSPELAIRQQLMEEGGPPLWSAIATAADNFMEELFLQGRFQGTTPQTAYFVKCDADNNPQSKIDQGIVTVLVGFAPLYPAEFVVIQIQQIAGQIA